MTVAEGLASISLRNILFPTNLASGSDAALAYAAALARRYHSTLHTVTVVPEEITDYVQPPDPFSLRHTAQKKMAELAGLDVLEGLKHREHVEDGFIPETLAEMIERLEIDLVVMGARCHRGVRRLVLGSVAEEIIHSTSCPVMAVGPGVAQPIEPAQKLKHILYATSLSHRSASELQYAVRLAESEHAKLTMLHVLRMPTNASLVDFESQREKTQSRLVQLIPPETASKLETEFLVDSGSPGDRILNVAERTAADLIVLGPRHATYTWASSHLPWVTLHQVLCGARCPVLTLHER